MKPHAFPPRVRCVEFCLLQRPHGTVITVSVDWSPPNKWKKELIRTHHIDFEGGLASSETGYYSHFSHVLDKLSDETAIVNYALVVARKNFTEQHPKGQFELFT